jgi:outer membrane lipase/esterase
MKFTLSTWGAIGASLLVAACGGGGDGGQTARVSFQSMVTFGDSLSDVGTYKVGTVAALGGGKYIINSASAKNWTELIAAQYALPAPCAAQTGLDGAAAQGFSVPVVNHTECRNYAQGGARVTNPVGPGNKLLGGSNAILGQLTVPVVTQISNHLGVVGGSFSGKELIAVMAGGNDGIIAAETYVGTLQAVTAGAGAAAAAAAAPTYAAAGVASMTTAGTDLANLIKTELLAKGAKYVVVVNMPNLGVTPYASAEEAKIAGSRVVIDNFSKAFNTALQTGLSGASNVRIVDAYSVITDQVTNPGQYALTNVTSPACGANALGTTSLVCTGTNVVAGDVSHYLFADAVHGTPFAYQLLAQLVSKELVFAGWL